MLVVRWRAAPVLFAVVLVACGSAAERGRPSVVATTTIIADLARNVAGARADVVALAPAGAAVEEYNPTPEDARHVAEANVLLVNGRDLDAWAAPLLKNRRSTAVVATLSDGLTDIDGNPHLWFDVQLARAYVSRIRDALTAVDPGGKDEYANRAAAYDQTLVQLDGELKAMAAALPQPKRRLVTSHDAFEYFARAYGFEIVGFVQPEPGKDPSAGELAALVRQVKAAGVAAIFSESQVSPRLVQTLATEAGVQRVVTDLPTDSLQDPPADTYVGLMRTVMNKIVSALR